MFRDTSVFTGPAGQLGISNDTPQAGYRPRLECSHQSDSGGMTDRNSRVETGWKSMDVPG